MILGYIPNCVCFKDFFPFEKEYGKIHICVVCPIGVTVYYYGYYVGIREIAVLIAN